MEKSRVTRINKRNIIGFFLFVSLISSCLYTSFAQSIEISDRFKDVIKQLIQEKTKEVVFNELKTNAPILAAGTHDLLDRIIAGDSIDEVHKQVIISTFDYVEFQDLRGLIQQKFPQQSLRKKDRNIVSQNEYLRVMNISSLIVYQFLATRDLLVISPGVEKTIQEYSDFMGSFLPLRGDTLSMSIDGLCIIL